MHHIQNFSCGGDSVVIVSGVGGEEENRVAGEIIKGAPLEVQPAFLKNTQIKMPTLNMAGAVFSADAALCAAAVLANNEELTLSSNALDAPFSISFDESISLSEIRFASRAKIHPTAAVPSVIFGGCEYFILPQNEAEKAEDLLLSLSEKSAQPCAALLVRAGDTVTPLFRQKNGDACAFSAGSAAVALAFFDSETSRDYFKATYRFPKGERHIEMKRFLSEPFECILRAQVTERG